MLPRLPARVYYAMAAFLATLAYLAAPGARRAVADNMRHVLGPQVGRDKLRQTVRAVFQHTARNYCELFSLPSLGREVERRLTVYGWEHIQGLRQQGKGIVIATAHLGNVDLAVQVLAARSIGTVVLAEPLRPRRLFELVRSLRESQGVSFLPVSVTSLKTAMRALKKGGMVAVACDRDVLGKGVRMSFFGEEATLPVGAVDLAAKTGAAILPAFSVRLPDGRFEIRVEPPLMVHASPNGSDFGRGARGASEPMEQIVACMEKHVRSHPEQWVVFERVWE